MLTSIISISILVLTGVIFAIAEKRSRSESTSSPSQYKQLTPADDTERLHWQEAQIYQAAEICTQRQSGRWLGGDITVYYDADMLSNSRDVSSSIKFLEEHAESNGIHLEKR